MRSGSARGYLIYEILGDLPAAPGNWFGGTSDWIKPK
jgi:hypothetical protein